MRVLIVDDESLARRGIGVRLRRFPEIEVVGECEDGASAVLAILDRNPDVVFLDVRMPRMDGFEVIRALPPDRVPAIIFLTAYEQHALRAFEVHAIDDLLKPPVETRFEAAIRRAKAVLETHAKAEMTDRLLRLAGASPAKYLSRVAVRVGSRIEVVKIEEVEWISSAGDYVELHGSGRTWLLRESMNSLVKRLDPAEFMRIHRSRIVRSCSITELRPIENREFVVKLIDGSQHRSSRTYADSVGRWIGPTRGS
jgi:two-component system LytT family response regulator